MLLAKGIALLLTIYSQSSRNGKSIGPAVTFVTAGIFCCQRTSAIMAAGLVTPFKEIGCETEVAVVDTPHSLSPI